MSNLSIRQDSKGYYYRNIGYIEGKQGRLAQPKIMLGKDRNLAEERLRRVEAVWQRVQEDHQPIKGGDKPLWLELPLNLAKAIGRGDKTYPVPFDDDLTPEQYALVVNTLGAMWPEIACVPDDGNAFLIGTAILGQRSELLQDESERIQAKAANVHFEATVLQTISGRATRTLKPIGGSLHKVMNSYIQWIEKEYADGTEGSVTDNGKTKIRQVRTLNYLLPDVPLGQLNYQKCDELFGILRKRPTSKRYDKRMARKSCSNYIGELKRMFEWLDTCQDYEWELPAKFDRIKRTPIELDSDIEHEAKDIPVYSIEELQILYKYATPIERFFFLLGLNCAFGADQSGRLRIGEVKFGDDNKRSFIGHLRRKKKVRGSHLLWRHTEIMLRWMIARHDSPDKTDRVAIHGNGNTYYNKTKGDNRRRDIPNCWYNLLNRVEKDHKDFPRYGFNILRDTSTNMVRDIGGEELASLQCSHKNQSVDKSLGSYSNPRRKALYRVHATLEKRLSKMFEAVPDPTKSNPQAYTTLGTIAKIKYLHDNGFSVQEIARIAEVHPTTVYRHVGKS